MFESIDILTARSNSGGFPLPNNQALYPGRFFMPERRVQPVALAQSIFKDPLEIKVTVDTSELDAALAKAENAAFMALAMMSLK